MRLREIIAENLSQSTVDRDKILVDLCDMILQGQKQRPDYYGMVAAAVVDSNGNVVPGLNYLDEESGQRRHAERAAIENYQRKYGAVPPGSAVITTLSPCSEPMDERYGESCQQLLQDQGIEDVYCGYQDPTQDSGYTVTRNKDLVKLCKRFADTFLKPKSLQEAQVPSVRDQILSDVGRHGGSPDQYFVRFTDVDKLGFSGRQWFGQTPDVDHPKFDVDYIGHGVGRRALWFYPLSTYLDQSKNVYASEQPYAWLVKLKPNAWLQTVKRGDKNVEPPPAGKQRVGLLRMSSPPAAIFFTHGYDVIGRYYNFADRHRRHGEVKGPPKPSWFDRVRGH